ncbi:GntR family transcriptional regulator [Kocuria coralli]|uniref:GntR family transcriptional regulator n=2 Tax=Kocuria coralli TaxID=1461025 RepID=A0A5J5KZA2_9MICC|nr:GntR family transcriptional regulator [Kocuria coralli]
MIRAELSVGDRLPGERKLVEQFGVSRITVRHAISQLVNDGLLTREHGRGTFVAHGMARSRLHLASFHEDMRAAGLKPSTRVDLVAEEEAPAEAAAHLGTEHALRVRRLRLGDGIPVSVDDCWLVPGLLPSEADWESSLYGMLAQAGAGITRAEQTVQAQAAGARDAALLGIQPGTPVLAFHRRSFSLAADGERPVEYSVSVYRADRYQIHMEVLA